MLRGPVVARRGTSEGIHPCRHPQRRCARRRGPSRQARWWWRSRPVGTWCARTTRSTSPAPSAADAELVALTPSIRPSTSSRLSGGGELGFDDSFPGREGARSRRVTYHVACHLQAHQVGLKSRDLLKLAGIQGGPSSSGARGSTAPGAIAGRDYELARKVAGPLKREVEAAGNAVVVRGLPPGQRSIEQETGPKPVHPIQLFARGAGPREGRRGARTVSMTGPLILDDIADLRGVRTSSGSIPAARSSRSRSCRRVGVGPVVTLIFESRMTIRFQVQEMAPPSGCQRPADPARARRLQPSAPLGRRALGHPVPRAGDR